jgi:signal transduction histidine kinase
MYNEALFETASARWVFRAYAILIGLAGFLLFGWGAEWFGAEFLGQPWDKAALIRVAGAILMAFACCAMPFALHGQPTRRRGLLWFAIAHFVVFYVLQLQDSSIWGPGLGQTAMRAAAICTFTLWIVYVSGLQQETCAPSAANLRSQYERQIREAARHEERNRLARDLHDSIKQEIFVIQTAAATAQVRFEDDQSGAKEALDQIRDAAREAMTEMQVMLDQLRAAPLENSGLIESLKKQCDALGFRTGAKVEFTLGELPAAETFAPGEHEAIQRVAQEALANIARHARARDVKVSLASEKGQVMLRIQDNGAGFDPDQQACGQGIGNMRARAAEFGGTLDLTSHPAGGTSVVLSIPYSIREAPARRRLAVTLGVAVAAAIPLLVWRDWLNLPLVPIAVLIVLMGYFSAYLRAWLRSRVLRRRAQSEPAR